MKVKGPNGNVFDLPQHVATGLIGGGHAESVTGEAQKKADPKKITEETPAKGTAKPTK